MAALGASWPGEQALSAKVAAANENMRLENTGAGSFATSV
jgi:hypothetical protein